MCILLNVKKHEKTFALNVDIFKMTLLHKTGRRRLQRESLFVPYQNLILTQALWKNLSLSISLRE